MQERIVGVLGLHRTTSRSSITSFAESIHGVLGLHRTTSRSSITSVAGSITSRFSITSFAGSINTKMAYKRFCEKLFQIGVTPEMITQNEGEILNIFNQPQDTTTSDKRNDGSDIVDQSQLLSVSDFPWS